MKVTYEFIKLFKGVAWSPLVEMQPLLPRLVECYGFHLPVVINWNSCQVTILMIHVDKVHSSSKGLHTGQSDLKGLHDML
jgi:hypothetical protein